MDAWPSNQERQAGCRPSRAPQKARSSLEFRLSLAAGLSSTVASKLVGWTRGLATKSVKLDAVPAGHLRRPAVLWSFGFPWQRVSAALWLASSSDGRVA